MTTETKPKAAPKPVETVSDGRVQITITKKGDGKVSTGRENEYFARGDVTSASKEFAFLLEERGYVEID